MLASPHQPFTTGDQCAIDHMWRAPVHDREYRCLSGIGHQNRMLACLSFHRKRGPPPRVGVQQRLPGPAVSFSPASRVAHPAGTTGAVFRLQVSFLRRATARLARQGLCLSRRELVICLPVSFPFPLEESPGMRVAAAQQLAMAPRRPVSSEQNVRPPAAYPRRIRSIDNAPATLESPHDRLAP